MVVVVVVVFCFFFCFCCLLLFLLLLGEMMGVVVRVSWVEGSSNGLRSGQARRW